MNLIPASAAKVCIGCNKELPLHAFPRHAYRADGRQDRCSPCKYRRDTETRRQKALRGLLATQPPDNVVRGRQEPIWGPGTYRPDLERTYFRNDGHKHLKSRGVLC